ncbi:hypothetical protein VPH35_019180 [Triticum aestivum]
MFWEHQLQLLTSKRCRKPCNVATPRRPPSRRRCKHAEQANSYERLPPSSIRGPFTRMVRSTRRLDTLHWTSTIKRTPRDARHLQSVNDTSSKLSKVLVFFWTWFSTKNVLTYICKSLHC